MQFDGALGELEMLKQQNAEKMSQLSKEVEYFRNMYKRSESACQQGQDELRSVKALNVNLMADKQQLQEDLAQLEKLREEDKREMDELRSQHHKAISALSGPGTGTSDVMTDLYDASLQKYEAMRKDYDEIRERYADLRAQHSSVCCQLDAMVDLRKQLDDMRRERDATVRDKIAFQQQCTTVIQNLEQMIHENRKLKATLDNVRHEHEGCTKDQRQSQAKQAQLQKDCNQALAERDAVVQEYKQVMSERDSVHKEIEQLQEKLSEMNKRNDKYLKEKTAAEKDIERLKQDLAALTASCEKYRQESQGALENRAQLESELRELQREFQLMEQQRDTARKERHQALEQMENLIKKTYEKTQKEKAEEMDQAVKETEELKKQLDKIRHELGNAEQEALVATKRRDWAFSEISKTVSERESIRTLCDNLRRDRDRAVSELAKALRNSDDCEKQKNDSVKELKEIRDKYEAIVERDARRQQLNSVGHNHSRDSAIDADLQEWETETLEIELDGGDGHDIGFEIIGGKDNPQFPGDTALFISQVTKGGPAEGKLRANDLLLKINNLDTTNTERRCAKQALRKHSRALTLVVRRRKSSAARTWQPLQLLVSCQKEGSIQVDQGLFISAIHSGRILSKDGMLPTYGDRIIRINHQETEKMTAQEAVKLMEKGSQSVVLDVLRQASPLSSTGSSPTPTTVSVLTPLAEHLSPGQSTAMSKSDTLATHGSLWDSTSGDSARSGGGSSKNLRSSGSQTDSLDSPGPSPPKSQRNHDLVRHSMPVLDKAKEIVVEKLFRARHKSQDRDRGVDRQSSRDEVHEKGRSKDRGRGERNHGEVMEDSNQPSKVSIVTQTPVKGVDDVIAEFSSSAFSRTSPDCKSRKREYEVDSNSGTWPKSRSGPVVSSSNVSTVAFMPHKARPSVLRDPFFFQAPLPPQQHEHSGDGGGGLGFVERDSVCHSQQNSDCSSSGKFPGGVGTASQSSVSSPKPSHFTVGLMQAPPNSGRPAFSKPWPPPASHNPQYPNPLRPHPRHTPPRIQTGPHPIHAGTGPKPIQPDAYPRSQYSQTPGGKSHRPSSAPRRGHNGENQWPPPPHQPWPHQLGPHTHPHPHSHHYPYSPKPLSPTEAIVRTSRPTSLEVPIPLRFGDVPGEEARVSSPVGASLGSGLPGGSMYAQPQYRYQSRTSGGPKSRYSSPPGTFSDFEPAMFHPRLSDPRSSPSPSQQSFTVVDRNTPTPSEEFGPPLYIRPYPQVPHGRPVSDMELRQPGSSGFHKHDKLQERIRIPSSNSVSYKSGSVEIVSDRSSPESSFDDFNRRGSSKGKRLSLSSSRDEYLYSPKHHETRTITFEKSSEPVGFQIQRGPAGGIFVSSVNDNSLASQAGLEIGDQLLEVCGINMRNATHEHAVTVLRQCGDNLSMKVQYNPEKYMDGHDSSSTISLMSSLATSPTHSKISSGDSEQSTPKHHTPQRSKSNSSADGTYERPHVVQFKRPKGDHCDPGFAVVGGNAVGIFVHEIQPDTQAVPFLQRGDMILEYNNISFHNLTAEQAILELKKPCSTMRLTVLNSVAKYNKVQNIPGDRFFIRTNFSRSAEGEGELDFHKDDILVVENTVHRGTLGLWLAWLVDAQGNKLRCGSIPSQLRLEDETVLRRSQSESWSLGDSEELKGSRRGSGSARRSFFRRKRHQRNNSKDSRDLGSFSDASLNSESVPILDEYILGYTLVDRIEYEQTRPVVLLAPLAEPLIRKLTSESPDKYKFCEPCVTRVLMKDMEQSLAEGRLVDYWKKDDNFECVQVNRIRDICDEKIHCLLNVNPRAIERLHRLKIYPIVIFVRHKNHKQIKEIRDSQFLPEKLNTKVAKDSYDHYNKLEQEYSHHFSTIIQGGNLAEMSTHIKAAINSEQKKAIWVTVSSL
ncbi:hypothetical protein V1264_012124 [Littorina saxatilis]